MTKLHWTLGLILLLGLFSPHQSLAYSCPGIFSTEPTETYQPLHLRAMEREEIRNWEPKDFFAAFQQGLEPDFHDSVQRGLFKSYLNQQVSLHKDSVQADRPASNDRFEDMVFTYVQLRNLLRPLWPQAKFVTQAQETFRLRPLSAAEALNINYFLGRELRTEIKHLYLLEENFLHLTLTHESGLSQGHIQLMLGSVQGQKAVLLFGWEQIPDHLHQATQKALSQLAQYQDRLLVVPAPQAHSNSLVFTPSHSVRFSQNQQDFIPQPVETAFTKDFPETLPATSQSESLEMKILFTPAPRTLPRLERGLDL